MARKGTPLKAALDRISQMPVARGGTPTRKWHWMVEGTPVPQGRPRAYKTADGHIRMYDPQSSKDWKVWVRYRVLRDRPAHPSEAAMALEVIFWLPRPKSLPQSVQHHIKKPDADNLLKAIKDALEGIYYRNDSQITDLYVFKRYTTGVAGAEITLKELDR